MKAIFNVENDERYIESIYCDDVINGVLNYARDYIEKMHVDEAYILLNCWHGEDDKTDTCFVARYYMDDNGILTCDLDWNEGETHVMIYGVVDLYIPEIIK